MDQSENMNENATKSVDQDTMKAIGMMSVAVFLLSAMNLGLKHLVEHYPGAPSMW